MGAQKMFIKWTNKSETFEITENREGQCGERRLKRSQEVGEVGVRDYPVWGSERSEGNQRDQHD